MPVHLGDKRYHHHRLCPRSHHHQYQLPWSPVHIHPVMADPAGVGHMSVVLGWGEDFNTQTSKTQKEGEQLASVCCIPDYRC